MNDDLVQALLAFIAQDGCSDDQFDAMALRLFAHQHANNVAYRRFCQLRGVTPRSVKSWRVQIEMPMSTGLPWTGTVPS